MKVIGQTGTKYIVMMEVGELSAVSGMNHGCYTDSTVIGKEYDVDGAWNRLKAIKGGAEELTKTADKLRTLADLLEPIRVEIPGEKTCENDSGNGAVLDSGGRRNRK